MLRLLQFPPPMTRPLKPYCVPATVPTWTSSSSGSTRGRRLACCTPSGGSLGCRAPQHINRPEPCSSSGRVVDVSVTLKALSINKHRSWYTYLTVWVVPRQIAKHGDLWAFATSPVEQRGARLKKFVRQVVSWRPYHDGWVAPSGPEDVDGSKPATVFIARRKYESCAMMQILRMCVSQEEMWAAPAIAAAGTGMMDLSVSERRMQAGGRSTLLKIGRGKGLRLPKLKEEVIDLT